MRSRLPLILSSCALLVALCGSTPLGHAALNAVPFAKSANFARLAGNAQKLNGRKSTLTGVPGTIPVVGSSGKLPGSLLDLSQYPTKSDVDQLAKPLASGLKSITGENVTDGSLRLADLGSAQKTGRAGNAPTGSPIPLPAHGCSAMLLGNFGEGVVGNLVIGTLTAANGNAVLPNTAAVVPSIVIKTTQGGAVPNLMVCNTGGTALTIPAGSVFHWRMIDAA